MSIGKNRAISTSKIKKIIVIKKNRIEKGIRVFDIGLNPLSKGDIFSKLILFLFEVKNEIKIIKVDNNK